MPFHFPAELGGMAEYRCEKNGHLLEKHRTTCPIDGSVVRKAGARTPRELTPTPSRPLTAVAPPARTAKRRGTPLWQIVVSVVAGLFALMVVVALITGPSATSSSTSSTSAAPSGDSATTSAP